MSCWMALLRRRSMTEMTCPAPEGMAAMAWLGGMLTPSVVENGLGSSGLSIVSKGSMPQPDRPMVSATRDANLNMT